MKKQFLATRLPILRRLHNLEMARKHRKRKTLRSGYNPRISARSKISFAFGMAGLCPELIRYSKKLDNAYQVARLCSNNDEFVGFRKKHPQAFCSVR